METLSIAQATKLGQILESCMVHVIKDCGYAFKNSYMYSQLLTRPDFLLYENENEMPFASVAVTATTNSQAWIKKRWRYIDEVWQLKSYFGPDFLSINLIISDPLVFQRSEMMIMDAFFDTSIIASLLPGGQRLINDVIGMLVSDVNIPSDNIVEDVTKCTSWQILKDSILEKLRTIIQEKRELVRKSIYRRIWGREHKLFLTLYQNVEKREYSTKASYLRYTALNGLLVGSEKMGVLCKAVKNDLPISKKDVDECKHTEFSFVKRLNHYYVSDNKLKDTVEAGFTKETYDKIEPLLITNDAQKYLIRDIQDDNLLMKMVEEIFPTIQNKTDIYNVLHDSYRSVEYKGIAHTRVWPLDIYINYLGTSALGINRIFTERYGHIGVANPINNFILKTAIIGSSFSSEKALADFCSKLSDVLFELLCAAEEKSIEAVYHDLKKSKQDALKLQPYINPLQRYLEVILHDNGYAYCKVPISCMLGAIEGIPGRMKRIEEIYSVSKDSKKMWIKCIAGYEGGVDHKTQEMAARGRLLQYETDEPLKRDTKLLFVYDGKWNKALQQSLALGGWDPIVSVFDLDRYLKSLDD